MASTVLVTIRGDAASAELDADVAVPLAHLLPTWAQQCSSQPVDRLVVVFGDNTRLFDLGLNLRDLGISAGSVIRLFTNEEAGRFLPAPPPPGPPGGRSSPAAPAWAGQEPGRPGAPAPPRPPEGYVAPWPPPDGPLPTLRSSHLAVRGATDGPTTGDGADRPAPEMLPVRVPRRRRLWAAIRAGLSPRAAASPPTGAFAKPTRPNAAQRYRSSLRATNRSHNLDMAIRAATLRRCMVIAVVSPKGGPGKTTITALLGTLLAELRRDPVIALDANPDLGDLKDKLGAPGATAMLVDDLAHWLDEHLTATPAELSARLGVGPHGLRYIPTPRPPECTKQRMIAATDFGLYQTLIARLRDYAGIVLVDCGTGLLDPPVRAALEAADQIVLVTDSSATTARQVVAAAGLLAAGTPTWLVANKMPQKGSMLDLAQVTAAIPRLHGVAVVPMPTGAHLAENIVTPDFTWADAPDAWQEPIRELAARLAGNWTASPGPSPTPALDHPR